MEETNERAPQSGVAVGNLLPERSQDRHGVRADASVQGLEGELQIEDLTEGESGAKETPQGDRAVVEVVHHLFRFATGRERARGVARGYGCLPLTKRSYPRSRKQPLVRSMSLS